MRILIAFLMLTPVLMSGCATLNPPGDILILNPDGAGGYSGVAF